MKTSGLRVDSKAVFFVKKYIKVSNCSVHHHAVSLIHGHLQQFHISSYDILHPTSYISNQHIPRTTATHS